MRLSAKISFLISGIALSIGILSLLAIRNVLFDTLQRDIEEKGSLTASMLAEHITPNMIESELVPVQEAIRDSVARTAGIVFVYVTGFDGRIVAHTFQGGFPSALAPAASPAGAGNGPRVERFSTAEGPLLVIRQPLIEGMRGAVHIGMNESLVYSEIDRVRIRIVGVTFAITVLGILIGVAVNRRIAQPLGQLAHAMESFGEGKPPQLVHIREGGREVSILAASFNKMIEERGRIEASLTWEAAASAAVAELASALVSSIPVEEISSRVVEHAKRLTDSPVGYAGYVEPRTKGFVIPAKSPEIPDRSGIRNEDVDVTRSLELRAWAISSRSALLSNDPRPDPRFVETLPGDLPVRRFLCAPALVGEEVVGQVAVANAERDYTDRDLELVRRLASLYAIALGHRRADEALRERENQLRQSQKMEAVGKLAGGVAHDFNNLLTVILGYGNLLLGRMQANDAARREVEEIRNAGLRAAALTHQLLAFSRRQVLQPKVIGLNGIVNGMTDMMRRLIGEDIELRTDLSDELGNVRADPGQIEQVIVNLVVNARDAMPGGGLLTIATRNVDLEESDLKHRVALKPGRYALLSLSDTGVGMSDEVKSRLFEPFFTTKEKGTGLGLSTAYGIVKQSEGYVWFYSEFGKGTTVKIYLPIVAERCAEEPPAPRPEGPVAGSETILLVEDEGGVRELAREVLRELGYTVLEARDGKEALDISGQYPDEIHLMLTDVVMPHLGGRDLATRVSPSRPGMKIVYMSGYTDDAITHHGVLDPDVDFLQKPFTPGTLARKIRKVLDAGPPAAAAGPGGNLSHLS